MMLFKCFIISIMPLIFNRKLPFQSRSSGTELCHTFTTTYTFKLLHQFQGFQRVKFIHAISVSDLNARTLPRLPPFPQCLKENRKKLHLYTRFFQPVHHLFSHCRPRDTTLQNCFFKTLFTWSGGPQSSGVGFFVLCPQSVKTKETNPTRPGSPHSM